MIFGAGTDQRPHNTLELGNGDEVNVDPVNQLHRVRVDVRIKMFDDRNYNIDNIQDYIYCRDGQVHRHVEKSQNHIDDIDRDLVCSITSISMHTTPRHTV